MEDKDILENMKDEQIENLTDVQKIQLDVIKELKAKMDTMVDPVKYKELKEQHERLLQEFVNKRPAPNPMVEKVMTKEDVADLSRQLIKKSKEGITNREYIELSLRHRKAMLDVYGKDPYGLNGEKSPEAQATADFFQSALDQSSSPSQFRMLLDEKLYDDPQVVQKVRALKADGARSRK